MGKKKQEKYELTTSGGQNRIKGSIIGEERPWINHLSRPIFGRSWSFLIDPFVRF
jgi:hypothetical protein